MHNTSVTDFTKNMSDHVNRNLKTKAMLIKNHKEIEKSFVVCEPNYFIEMAYGCGMDDLAREIETSLESLKGYIHTKYAQMRAQRDVG